MDKTMAVKDVVYKLQLSLLEGIQNEDQLFAAGSILSRADYQDVVTERSIVNICGYPLCHNSLPVEQPRKGRYRISLKEHKVYDLHETYMYCSTECVISSRAFAGSLQEGRVSTLNPGNARDVLKLFEDVDLEKSEEGMGKDGDFGLSKLKIHENVENKGGEVSLDDWIGPPNAIEGYAPQRNRHVKPPPRKSGKQGSKSKPSSKNDFSFNELDFMSTIITSDEYSISKTPANHDDNTFSANRKEINRDSKLLGLQEQITALNKSSSEMKGESKDNFKSDSVGTSSTSSNEAGSCDLPSSSNSYQTVEAEKDNQTKTSASTSTMPKSSLKPSGSKKHYRSVTWADEKPNSAGSCELCEFSELQDMKEGSGADADDDNMLRYASAEACAAALSKAAEAVASENCDGGDPVAEAGITILPPSSDVDGVESIEDMSALEQDSTIMKWPTKSGSAHSDLLDSEDSWFDEPPEGLSLTLSTFATMWMALFAWISSSSLAYIYGRDERFQEEFLSINGREYPQKIVLGDGRSSEIKQTLGGCLSRALPGLVAEIRLPIPITSLEQGLARLLDTMSFIDAIPALRMKQWQVIVLLFIDALSVCRIPAVTPHLTNRRQLLHKVLNGAMISVEEYEIMTDFIIPLGRAPQFSSRSGA